MSIPCEFSYTRESRMDPAKRTVHEGIMGIDEKLKRALAEDWELVGDPWQLCQILRAEVHRLRKLIGRDDPVECVARGAIRERAEVQCGQCGFRIDGSDLE